MKKILSILAGIVFTCSVFAQPYIHGVVASSAESEGGGCTNTNYGDESTNIDNTNYTYSNWNTYVGPITVTGGEVQSISLYIGTTADATSMYAAIYTNSGGEPNTLVSNSVSNELTSISTSSWHTFTFSTNPTLSSGDYWISIARDGANTEIGNAGGGYAVRDESWGGTFPATAGSSGWLTDFYISTYMTICVE